MEPESSSPYPQVTTIRPYPYSVSIRRLVHINLYTVVHTHTRLDMLQVIKFCKPVCVFTLSLSNDAAIKTADRRMTG
jgi:hypothetical protein